MTGTFWIAIVVSAICYQFFCEFVARREDRRYRTDIDLGDVDYLRECGIVHETATASSARSNTHDVALRVGDRRHGESDRRSQISNPHHRDPSLRWNGWKAMRIESVVVESPDCKSFIMVSDDDKPLPRFFGGQSLLVRVSHPETGRKVSRCYSLSGGPAQTSYRITVKRVPGGQMSNLLHDHVRSGDLIEAQSPSGKFHLDLDQPHRPVNLIAAGIGITPMLSMLLNSLEESPARSVNLFYQLRDRQHAPFLDALAYLATALSGQRTFRLHLWFSDPTVELELPDSSGRINGESLLEKLGHNDGDFMICGPDAFMTEMATSLVANGVPEDAVAYESFGGTATGPGAIAVKGDESGSSGAAISTEDSGSQEDLTVAANHQVGFSASAKSAAWKPTMDSLLELAESIDADVDSGCRAGNCGTCVRRLSCGTVQYLLEPECELENGEAALCVAVPTSEVVIDA